MIVPVRFSSILLPGPRILLHSQYSDNNLPGQTNIQFWHTKNEYKLYRKNDLAAWRRQYNCQLLPFFFVHYSISPTLRTASNSLLSYQQDLNFPSRHFQSLFEWLTQNIQQL